MTIIKAIQDARPIVPESASKDRWRGVLESRVEPEGVAIDRVGGVAPNSVTRLAGEPAITRINPERQQPPGLLYLAFAEAWERFSFYGMQSLLVLYMVDKLLGPGHIERVLGFAEFKATLEGLVGPLSGQALASQIMGLYAGFVYLTPVFGGLLGDRLLGQRRTVVLGAIMMAGGHALMTLEPFFLVALALLVCGAGCLKGNISAQVGRLYAPEDRRRDAAFSIFNVGINVGAFVAPLVCGTLGEVFGWHYGFGAAAVGMLIGLAVYLAGYRHLPADRPKGGAEADTHLATGDKGIIVALVGVLVIGIFFQVAHDQGANVYPIWAREAIDRRMFGFEMPVTWFQSLGGAGEKDGWYRHIVQRFLSRRLLVLERSHLRRTGCSDRVDGSIFSGYDRNKVGDQRGRKASCAHRSRWQWSGIRFEDTRRGPRELRGVLAMIARLKRLLPTKRISIDHNLRE